MNTNMETEYNYIITIFCSKLSNLKLAYLNGKKIVQERKKKF